MKLGLIGPIGGIILAAAILGATVKYTPVDSKWRLLGLGVAVVVFGAAVGLAIRGENR